MMIQKIKKGINFNKKLWKSYRPFYTKTDKTVDNGYITQFWAHYKYPLHYTVVIMRILYALLYPPYALLYWEVGTLHALRDSFCLSTFLIQNIYYISIMYQAQLLLASVIVHTPNILIVFMNDTQQNGNDLFFFTISSSIIKRSS